MTNRSLKLLAAGLFFTTAIAVAAPIPSKEICPKPWHCEKIGVDVDRAGLTLQPGPLGPMVLPTFRKLSVEIRAGYFPESGTFRGNVIYFQGLGDSMVNHAPLFRHLSAEGFRVIAFDYMGQGGSEGRMDQTRIDAIAEIGEVVWKKYARDLATYPKKSVIGWSTGGLAAYMAASRGEADQIAIIAPGIAPRTVVGAGILNWPPNEITPESLTTAAPYSARAENPHLDPIRPNTPLKVPNFAVNLLTTAGKARKTAIPRKVRGLVLLSDDADTYVDAGRTAEVLARTAPHFQIIQYAGALHEIDNERAEISRKSHHDIAEFLKDDR